MLDYVLDAVRQSCFEHQGLRGACWPSPLTAGAALVSAPATPASFVVREAAGQRPACTPHRRAGNGDLMSEQGGRRWRLRPGAPCAFAYLLDFWLLHAGRAEAPDLPGARRVGAGDQDHLPGREPPRVSWRQWGALGSVEPVTGSLRATCFHRVPTTTLSATTMTWWPLAASCDATFPRV